MIPSRPDLTGVSPEVLAYIEALETELAQLRKPSRAELRSVEVGPVPESEAEPAERPTTLHLITISGAGLAKRTPRHLYHRQSRGGMGIFDLDAPSDDAPAFLAIADQSQVLVVVTSQGRAFPLAVSQLAETPIRARGQLLTQLLPLQANERIAIVFPDQGSGYLVLATVRGQVRRLRYHYFGLNLKPGTILHDVREGGAPAAWCWSAGDADLFIATRKGIGIRFAETQVPVRGCLGIRVDPDDAAVGIAPVREESGVFMLGTDGKGTIRLMTGFSRNKEPGSGGKVAMKTDRLLGAMAVSEKDDIFIISRLGKIIRFRAAEVPAKEGVVQGVNCMGFRADEATAMAIAQMEE